MAAAEMGPLWLMSIAGARPFVAFTPISADNSGRACRSFGEEYARAAKLGPPTKRPTDPRGSARKSTRENPNKREKTTTTTTATDMSPLVSMFLLVALAMRAASQPPPPPPPHPHPHPPGPIAGLGHLPNSMPKQAGGPINLSLAGVPLPPIFAQQPPPPGADEVCGLNMKELRHERIVGGRSASYAEVPFIVHLRESHLFRVLGYNKCGGVLINHRWALTAAHCKPAFFSSLEIILGKHKTFEDAPPPEGSAMASIVKLTTKSFGGSANEIDIDVPPNWRKHPVLQVLADTVIVHPNYDQKTLENDLALIKLKRPIPYREDIQPICLPAVDEDFTGLDGYATGWGLTDFDKRQLPDTLQIVRLPVISNKRCQSMYKKAGHDKQITDFDLCAGYAKGGMDACEGDSGGPLIVRRPNDHRWTLAGIVSNGVKCGEPLLPGVYTRVSRFVPWISEQMRLHA